MRQCDTDAMFEHTAWVLTLARRLVGEAAADDVAQQTMIAALRRAPQSDRPLRPWLARVARGFAQKWSRGERRRRAREQVAAAAQDFAVPSAAELAESAELLRALVAEVGRLDEPLRAVVTLRYLHGLNATEVGARLCIPAGTVRWRLTVGIERLRARLDERTGGDRARWATVLATSLGVVPAAARVASRTIALLAAGALALMALGGYVATDREPAPAASADAARTSTAMAVDLTPAGAATPAAGPDVRRVAAAEPSDVPPLASDLAGIRVQATDERGAPLAMAELAWGRNSDSLAFTDARGTAWLQLRPPGDGVRLQFTLAARDRAVRVATAAVSVGAWTDLGTLELPRAVAVRGRVTAPGLAPIAGATVFVTAAPAMTAAIIDAQLGPVAWPTFACEPVLTADDGTFVLTAPALPVRVVAVADDREFGMSLTLDLAADQAPLPVELCCPPLPPGSRIALQVVDADGHALPGARACRKAAAGPGGDPGGIRRPRWFTADDRGAVVIPARAPIDYELRVEAPDCAPQTLSLQRAGDEVRVALYRH